MPLLSPYAKMLVSNGDVFIALPMGRLYTFSSFDERTASYLTATPRALVFHGRVPRHGGQCKVKSMTTRMTRVAYSAAIIARRQQEARPRAALL